jgi:peptidylprolyl isomerase
VHYTGKLSDGNVFDSSENRDPLEFTVGDGTIIPGFEKAVEGMEPGEEKMEEVPYDQAYGQRRDELVFQVKHDQLPPDLTPEVGQRLEMVQRSGQSVPVTVAAVGEHNVKLDANHPLAGRNLTFTVRLLEIVAGA